MNYQKRWREKRKKLGLCQRCGKPSRRGKAYCAICGGKRAAASKALRDRLREEGLCIQCGRWPAVPGYSLCPGCRSKDTERKRRRREQQQRAGTCPICGKRPTAAGRASCKKCLAREQARAVQLMATAKEARGSRCEVCGWRARPELLEWHHWKFNGKADRAARPKNKALREVIEGRDRHLMCVCPNCHRALHHDRLEFNPRTGKTRRRRK